MCWYKGGRSSSKVWVMLMVDLLRGRDGDGGGVWLGFESIVRFV